MSRMRWDRVAVQHRQEHSDVLLKGQPPKRKSPGKPRVFAARFRGVCSVCRLPFGKGVRIRKVTGTAAYRHERC